MNTTTSAVDARQAAYSMPLDQIDVSDPQLFHDDSIGHYFERLRREDPVHYRKGGKFGDFWSVTKYKDIMQVDTNHGAYSSELLRREIAAAVMHPSVREKNEGFGNTPSFSASSPEFARKIAGDLEWMGAAVKSAGLNLS